MRWLHVLLVVIYVSSLLTGSTRSASDSWMDVQQAKFSDQSVVMSTAQQIVLEPSVELNSKEKLSGPTDPQDCLADKAHLFSSCQFLASRIPSDHQLLSIGHHRQYRSRAPPVRV